MTPNELTQAVERVHTARPQLRDALHQSAVQTALALAEERDQLEALLEKRWKWLDDHNMDTSTTDDAWLARENAVLEALDTYKAMQNALAYAAEVLFGIELAKVAS